MIHIKFFANLRERLGLATFELEYSGEQTVNDLLASLFEQEDKLLLLKEQDVLVAVNQTLCGTDAAIQDNDEVAFFPPVTGG